MLPEFSRLLVSGGASQYDQELIMQRINIVAIESRARAMRAEEMRRLSGIFAERSGLYFRLMGGTLGSVLAIVSETLRPLFSWCPQQHQLR